MDDNNIQLHTENSPLLSSQDTPGENASSADVEKGEDILEDVSDSKGSASIIEDIIDTFHLALPIFISRVSNVGMKTTDTALLGHVSGKALSAAALSDLWTMCTTVLIQGRVLSIFVGQAVGANNHHLALVYLRISYLILGTLSIFVMISWLYTEHVWVWLGQSVDVAQDAGYYSFVFIFAIPAQLIFSQLSQFLSAQRIMKPEVAASLVALACNLSLGLGFVLGIAIPKFDGYGFKACPIVTVVVVWCQCLMLYFYWLMFGDGTSQATNSSTEHKIWPYSWIEGITIERIVTFSKLYFPAALALSSDFWRMGAIGEAVQ